MQTVEEPHMMKLWKIENFYESSWFNIPGA